MDKENQPSHVNHLDNEENQVKIPSTVQVAVRVRPMSKNEQVQGSESCVQVCTPMRQIILNGSSKKQFTFDYVFDKHTEQENIYNKLVCPMIKPFFKGYNATIMAYGQTGSGKTYTMGNEFECESSKNHNEGIIPRVMKMIFDHMESNAKNIQYSLELSYLEILNEEIHDLLSSSNEPVKSLIIREEPKQGIVIQGLSKRKVSSLKEISVYLTQGRSNRATAATDMNAVSSRSHAICTLTLHQQFLEEETSQVTNILSSKFHLVDLAGSERAKKTNTSGLRFKEGVNINKGLLSLGNVINALSQKKENSHIPYRDSKLTRLLQDSLGGNSWTILIACCSPADTNWDESLSTLRYASRAKKIENNAIINHQEYEMQTINSLKQQVEILQLKLLQSQRQKGSSISLCEEEEMRKYIEKKHEKVQELQQEIQEWKNLMIEIQKDIPIDGRYQEKLNFLMRDLHEVEEMDADKNEDEDDEIEKEIIEEKEKLLNAFVLKEEDGEGNSSDLYFVELRNEYETKILNLENELKEYEQENEALKQSVKQKELRKELKKMKVLQLELMRLEKLKQRGDLHINHLQDDLLKLKQQKVLLQKNYQNDMKLKRKEQLEQKTVINQYKQKDRKQSQELNQLKEKQKKTELILKRKMEQISMAQKRIQTLIHQKTKKNKSVKMPNKDKEIKQGRIDHINQFIDTHMTLEEAKEIMNKEIIERKKLVIKSNEASFKDKDRIQKDIKEKTNSIQQFQEKIRKIEQSLCTQKILPENLSLSHEINEYLIEQIIEEKNRLIQLEKEFIMITKESEEEKRLFEREKQEILQQVDLLEQEKMELSCQLEMIATLTCTTNAMQKQTNDSKEQEEQKQEEKNEGEEKEEEYDESIVVVDDDSDYIPPKVDEDGNKKNEKEVKRVSSSGQEILNSIDDLLQVSSFKVSCDCNGKCATKQCPCKAKGNTCGDECSCCSMKCRNGKLNLQENAENINKENEKIIMKPSSSKGNEQQKKRKILSEINNNLLESQSFKRPLYSKQKQRTTNSIF